MSDQPDEGVRRHFNEARQRIQEVHARFAREIEDEVQKIRERTRHRLETL